MQQTVDTGRHYRDRQEQQRNDQHPSLCRSDALADREGCDRSVASDTSFGDSHHGHELFRRRRVDADCRIEISLGGTGHHSNTDPLHDFTGIRTNHMRRNDPVTGGFDDQLHKGLFRTTRQVVLHGIEFTVKEVIDYEDKPGFNFPKYEKDWLLERRDTGIYITINESNNRLDKIKAIINKPRNYSCIDMGGQRFSMQAQANEIGGAVMPKEVTGFNSPAPITAGIPNSPDLIAM